MILNHAFAYVLASLISICVHVIQMHYLEVSCRLYTCACQSVSQSVSHQSESVCACVHAHARKYSTLGQIHAVQLCGELIYGMLCKQHTVNR